MKFRLVDNNWGPELLDGLRLDHTELQIICPFIKRYTLDKLLSPQAPNIRVITRFNLSDFAEGVSDIDALRKLLDVGAAVRGIRGLHAKLYLFGSSRAIVTSANLTESGLGKNYELGVVTENKVAIASCRAYFDALWQRGGKDLRSDKLDEWDSKVTRHLASGGRPHRLSGLGDFGADAGFIEPTEDEAPLFTEAPQAFVKFLGTADDRVSISSSIEEEVRLVGCHRKLHYPKKKRPKVVKDGAAMFIARLTDEPDDVRVFGRAIAMEHKPGRDDATADDIALGELASHWPHFVRVHHADFVNGTMKNGISLNALMEALGTDSFAPTQRNATHGSGNTNPRRAYIRQPAVQLSTEGHAWLNERLQNAFHLHGKVPKAFLDDLDWPDLPDVDSITDSAASRFTQEAFDEELQKMLDDARSADDISIRVVSGILHSRVVGESKENRMPMACNAMWKLWTRRGSDANRIIRTTKSKQSSTIEIEFVL